jgi:transposase-like protein
VTQAAEKVGVSRQTLHAWLARYEAEGLEGLVDRSHRPVTCPHQMPAVVEAAPSARSRSASTSRLSWSGHIEPEAEIYQPNGPSTNFAPDSAGVSAVLPAG